VGGKRTPTGTQQQIATCVGIGRSTVSELLAVAPPGCRADNLADTPRSKGDDAKAYPASKAARQSVRDGVWAMLRENPRQPNAATHPGTSKLFSE
jgi:hypothetical protein